MAASLGLVEVLHRQPALVSAAEQVGKQLRSLCYFSLDILPLDEDNETCNLFRRS